ncbi:hypothetical protein L9F63_011115, partial [Diploptera punctata]
PWSPKMFSKIIIATPAVKVYVAVRHSWHGFSLLSFYIFMFILPYPIEKYVILIVLLLLNSNMPPCSKYRLKKNNVFLPKRLFLIMTNFIFIYMFQHLKYCHFFNKNSILLKLANAVRVYSHRIKIDIYVGLLKFIIIKCIANSNHAKLYIFNFIENSFFIAFCTQFSFFSHIPYFDFIFWWFLSMLMLVEILGRNNLRFQGTSPSFTIFQVSFFYL